MAQSAVQQGALPLPRGGGRAKFLVGGVLIIAAIVYLVVTTLQSTQQFFLTVEEMQARGGDVVGKNLRVSGAVLGDTIEYDPNTLTTTFVMVNISNDAKVLEDQGGLAEALHTAVLDPNAARVKVVYQNQPMPDLLKNEAQAIVTGQLSADGVFHADELLLKCPTRYEDAVPQQADGASG
jgi:cytochrome c-type biogenesis protein CcmE